jgi:hypothetical protein
MFLKENLSKHWNRLQHKLFPEIENVLGPLSEKHITLITVLETVQIGAYLPYPHGYVGRPCAERAAVARAFIAKAIYNLPTTRLLIDLLEGDVRLRRLCGWECRVHVPKEWTFSRAFAEFAETQLPAQLHEALIKATLGTAIIGHISRDGTAIEAREKPVHTPKPEKIKKKLGRPRKGEAATPPKPGPIQQQMTMKSLEEMLAALPGHCNVGSKCNASGYKESWTGYGFHIDTADGDIPVSAILTSASMHDSRAAIPLAIMTSQRVTSLYDLMDAAYDDPNIRQKSIDLGHIPIIDINPRRNAALAAEIERETKAKNKLNFQTAEDVRYNQRSSAERVNSNLKDNFGGRHVRVRGHAKVYTHVMFGLLSITALQLMRLVT